MSACAFSVTGDDSSAARSLATIYEFSSGPTAACMPPWGFTCVDMSERDRPGQRGFLPCYESDSSDSTRYVGAMPLEWSGEVRRRRCRRPCRLPDGRGGARASLLPSAAIYGHLRPPTAVYGRLGSQATRASRVCTGETATLAGQPASLANEQRTAVVAREGSDALRPAAGCLQGPRSGPPGTRAIRRRSASCPRSGRGRGVEIELVPARSFIQLLVTRVDTEIQFS